MTRYFIELAFKGTNYNGWQIQPKVPTVQEAIEKALSVALQEHITVTGAGRTDTGVHASFFMAHFDSSSVSLEHSKKLVHQLNGILEDDIVVYKVLKVKPEAHARFSALSRTYTYTISKIKEPFNKDLEYLFTGDLDMDKMNMACHLLFKFNDFTSFARLHSQTETNLCKITDAGWVESKRKLVFTITADRFLRNMVRAIVGTLIEIGREKLDPQEIGTIIKAMDRSKAGPSAPAQGLCLSHIEYPPNIFVKPA